MARTPSTMLDLGTPLPEFSLPDTTGALVSSSDFHAAKGLLVVFMCNHCPFVKHLSAALADLGRECETLGVAMVGINSNDADNYPDDSPEKMKEEVAAAGYTFPYLFDADQSVAKAFRAACTPDFFLFDRGNKLVYRGQFDDSRPGNGIAVSGADLRQAIADMAAGNPPATEQKPSLGCNIKWKPGNEPDYFG